MLYGLGGYIKIWQIDHNLHNHVFDDIKCKPPIDFVLTKVISVDEKWESLAETTYFIYDKPIISEKW